MAGTEKKRMAITVDFYEKEVYEAIEALALLAKKKKSAYIRDVLTEHCKQSMERMK